MVAIQNLPLVPHQVALSGIVTDAETSQRLAGVTVTITAMPLAFQGLLAGRALQYGALWTTMTERPDRASTAGDGSFHFVDLPDGAYTLTFSVPRSAGLYGGASIPLTVARDAQGKISSTVEVVPVPPTGVRGLVSGAPPGGGEAAPIPAARAQVRGSGDVAHTGSDGSFYLPSVETGTLTLDITASSFERATMTVTIAAGAITDAGTTTLVATAPG